MESPEISSRLELADATAETFAEAVTYAAESSKNERDFQIQVDRLLDEFAQGVSVELAFKGEYTLLAGGRADSIYNRLIIEYEPPGSLRSNTGHPRTAHSINQAKNYIDGLAKTERHARDRLLGVCLDGFYLIFVRHSEDDWYVEPPLEWSPYAARRLLTSLVSLSSGRALTPENLVRDFGVGNVYSAKVTHALYEALEGHEGDLVNALFEQWKLWFSEVTAYEEVASRLQKKKELLDFALAMQLDPKTIDIGRFLFAIHTYFSFLAKAIARLVLERYSPGHADSASLYTLAEQDSENLRKGLAEIERGGVFRALGFVNLLEGDFFGWYLDAWTTEVFDALRITLRRLSDYNPATVEQDPFSARDLLKKLYHFLLPRELRHDLGEYYTPDWLATFVLEELEEPSLRVPADDEIISRESLDVRLLDPACGSGTFLILAISAFKENARRAGLSESEVLDRITQQIVGLDLNPLAVLASRVGYVLAIADLVPYARGPIRIPVYLADSILTPTEGMTLFEHRQRRLSTVVGQFPVPVSIDSSEELEALADLLYEYVESSFTTDDFVRRACKEFQIDHDSSDGLTLRELYELASSLKAQGKNGIWARILKNAFMPLFIGEFDYIAGNPPWIGWEHLPAGYRQQTTQLWSDFGLFMAKGMDTILGKGRKDLSILMTYVSLDRFLKPGGKMGFLITQSVFKGGGSSQGFRRFELPDGSKVKVEKAHDLSALKPFEGAANRTSIVFFEKGKSTEYPVPYFYWIKTARGKGLKESYSLRTILNMTQRNQMEASPVDEADSTSPWLSTEPGLAAAVRKVLGPSHYVAHEGANTGGGSAVYWLEVLEELSDGLLVRNRTEAAKYKVEDVSVELEPNLIYPLLKLGDLDRWSGKPVGHILMTQDPQTRRGIDLEVMKQRYPRTLAYLKQFEGFLRSRAAFKRYFMRPTPNGMVETGPFYSMFNVGPYTFAPWKTIWGGIGSDIAAAVIEREIIPQHTITLVGLETSDEAHYVCAVLNATPFRFAALAYAQVGGKSFGTPHILQTVRIPKFDHASETHRTLAALSQEAHKTPVDSDSIEREIDELARYLWDLSKEELGRMQISLRESRTMSIPNGANSALPLE